MGTVWRVSEQADGQHRKGAARGRGAKDTWKNPKWGHVLPYRKRAFQAQKIDRTYDSSVNGLNGRPAAKQGKQRVHDSLPLWFTDETHQRGGGRHGRRGSSKQKRHSTGSPATEVKVRHFHSETVVVCFRCV